MLYNTIFTPVSAEARKVLDMRDYKKGITAAAKTILGKKLEGIVFQRTTIEITTHGCFSEKKRRLFGKLVLQFNPELINFVREYIYIRKNGKQGRSIQFLKSVS